MSYCKKINSWAIGYIICKYNYAINLERFFYFVYCNNQVGYNKAKELARKFCKKLSYKKVQRILKNHDLTIERKEFYNFTPKKVIKKLKP